jgi:3-oxoacyl-[acyl-carrier-protein] synthase-3
MQLVGTGECVGADEVSNEATAKRLGLPDDWFTKRTGIVSRRVASASQSVLTMAADAVAAALEDAACDLASLGHETVLFYIENGTDAVTPPSAIRLCEKLRLRRVRAIALDGVCAEPIAALELADLLLAAGRCERVIIVASADFSRFIKDDDRETVGLFGAGAGALVLVRGEPDHDRKFICGQRYETHSEFSDAGRIDVLSMQSESDHIGVSLTYYRMNGRELAGAALRLVPDLILDVLTQAEWSVPDVDYVVAHQPNAKLLLAGLRRVGIERDRIALPVISHGNMGPASILVALDQSRKAKAVDVGSRVLLVSFGLGFSCGAAAVIL